MTHSSTQRSFRASGGSDRRLIRRKADAIGSIGDGHWPTELDISRTAIIRHPKIVEILMKSYHVRYIPVLLLLALTGLRGN